MDQMPAENLDSKIKSVWRLNDAIWLTVIFAFCFIVLAIIGAVEPNEVIDLLIAITVAVYAVLLILFVAILPPIRFARWHYSISANYLEIAKGIIWRKHYVIPFIRVQNTDTSQGPILRMFKLASVTISTAAGEHQIPGLDQAQAAQLRDKAAEFARLAREDV